MTYRMHWALVLMLTAACANNSQENDDQTPPEIIALQPSGTLAAGTTSATLAVTTNEAATCKWDLSPTADFASMDNVFTADASGTEHHDTVSVLVNGTSYTYYVRCSDVAGNANPSSTVIGFNVASASGVALLAEKYPNDLGIEKDPAVLFHSDFENGLNGWTSYSSTPFITVVDNGQVANSGKKFLQAKVTRANLAKDQYISANARFEFPKRVPEMWWRFHARFVGTTATPHHWVRVAAGDATYDSDGLANTVPPGNKGFWFDLDARREQLFGFYVYWYKMRSGRCDDGTAIPGCKGDQGTTYYYGNNFVPANQEPFPRDKWFCLEIHTKANSVGSFDGELTLWKDDQLVGEYRTGTPRGRWLRDNFYSWGQYFQDLQAFAGFDFRSSEEVKLKAITLDAYYQQDTLDSAAPQEQVILYDDVVVATQRIGCRRP